MPAEARTTLDEALGLYRRRHATCRWLPVESWHLTLLFLGAVDPGRVAELERILAAVAATQAPFRVTVHGGDGRAGRDEGVAWLRIGAGASALLALADRLAAACPRDLTLSGAPRRAPSAHLTVARRATPAFVADLRDERLGRLRASWTIASVALLRSHLGPGGSRYETLGEAALYAADETSGSPAEEGEVPWR